MRVEQAFLYFCAMQYKELFKRTYNLLRQPRLEWQKIAEEENNHTKVINDFVLPMIGLCALSAFLGQLFQSSGLEKALIAVIVSLGKHFGAVYLSFFILQETASYFGLKRNKTAFMQIAGYGLVTVFVVDIVYKLIPELFFLPILELYIIYLIWEGVEVLTTIDDKKRVSYVLFAALLLLALSFGIEAILSNTIVASSEIVAG